MNVRTNEKIITLGVVCNQCGHVIEDEELLEDISCMTRKPSVSVGLRPQRSTSPMAIKVASTLVSPTMTVPHICSVVLV